MGVSHITIYQCDRCGRQSQSKMFEERLQPHGNLTISANGYSGSYSWAGDGGGAYIKTEHFICFKCSALFMKILSKFMNGADNNERHKKP